MGEVAGYVAPSVGVEEGGEGGEEGGGTYGKWCRLLFHRFSSLGWEVFVRCVEGGFGRNGCLGGLGCDLLIRLL